jgi:hypothetical protein
MESRRRARSRVAALALVFSLGSALASACAFDENGAIDLGGRQCIAGGQAACYTGPAGTLGVGQCKPGANVCRIDGFFGECIGDVVPAEENCDTFEDEDCDGVGRGDDECRCTPGETKPCDTGQTGVCAAGERLCAEDGAAFSTCMRSVDPGPEDCATDDDEDCDGYVAACTGFPDTSASLGGVSSDVAFAVATNGLVHAAAGVANGQVAFRAVDAGNLYIDRRGSKLDVSWSLEIPSTGAGGRSA